MKYYAADPGKLFILLMVFGCGGLEPVTPHEPVTDPARLFVALTLDHGGINLSTVAPYHTIQVTATPRNALGEAMSGLPPATFRSSDTTAVRVTAEGLIEALQPATGIEIVAELVTEENVRQVDTAFVNVSTLSTPPVLESFSIQPVPPDSAVRAMRPAFESILSIVLQLAGIGTPQTISPRAVDTNGNAIPDLAVHYRSLDPAVGSIHTFSGQFDIARPGQLRIVASTTAYGVTRTDTVLFTVTLPIFQGIQILPTPNGAMGFAINEVRIRRNGFVFWINNSFTNPSGQPVDITFDDPTSVAEATLPCHAPRVGLLALFGDRLCGAGDIPSFNPGNLFTGTRVRQFPVPGVYPYRSTLTGATGRVVVSDD